MSSVPTDASTMRATEQLHLEDAAAQTERSQWVLNSPNPPPLWKKILSPVKDTKLFSSSKKETGRGRRALSFLGSLFPILIWFRSYKASKFKDDLLAGLTLASLSIPQVYIHKACLDFPLQLQNHSLGKSYKRIPLAHPNYDWGFGAFQTKTKHVILPFSEQCRLPYISFSLFLFIFLICI